MHTRSNIAAIAAGMLVGMTAMSAAQQPMTIRAGTVSGKLVHSLPKILSERYK